MGRFRAIHVASVHNLKFPFAAFSIYKTKKSQSRVHSAASNS